MPDGLFANQLFCSFPANTMPAFVLSEITYLGRPFDENLQRFELEGSC